MFQRKKDFDATDNDENDNYDVDEEILPTQGKRIDLIYGFFLNPKPCQEVHRQTCSHRENLGCKNTQV